MFCMNCGKKIDDDSKFCPFCGSTVGGTIQPNEQTQITSTGSQMPSLSALKAVKKPLSKNAVIGVAACLVAVLAVIGVIKLFTGGFGKTVAEQLFQMPWTEIAELDDKEFKDILHDEGIAYNQSYDPDSSYCYYNLYTKSVDSFLGYDSYFGYEKNTVDNLSTFWGGSGNLFRSTFGIVFETKDEYIDAKEDILQYLNKNLEKGYDAIIDDEGDFEQYIYLMDIDMENSDKLNEMLKEESDSLVSEETQETIEDYKMYKFSLVRFFGDNGYQLSDLTSNFDIKDNPNYGCVILNAYRPMTDDEFLDIMASVNYDVLSHEEIDLVEVSKEIDVDLLDEGVQDSDDYLRAIYFVEHHGIDIMSGMDVSSDELKKIWYIRNFGWDHEAGSFVDLSDYSNNKEIYCALTFNYDIREDTYFEDDFTKAIYLAEKNYNPETEKTFESEDEKNLYFLKNYSYDILTKKKIDDGVVEVLFAYADYIEEVFAEDEILGYNLIYIDDNDIPECVVWVITDEYNALCRAFVLSYKNDHIESVTGEGREGYGTTVGYNLRSGDFWVSFSDDNWCYCDIFSLDDSFHKVNAISYDSSDAENLFHGMNGQTVSYDEYSMLMGVELYSNKYTILHINVYDKNFDDIYKTLLDAYNALRVTTYAAYSVEITKFDLADNILTVEADADSYGVRDGFAISYPVSEDCTWEYGYYNNDGSFVSDEYESFEYMKEEIAENQQNIEVQSQILLCVEVVDDTVVRVYRVIP